MPDPESVPTCEQAGVFGALCGAVGSLMAMEAMKHLTGAGEPLRGRHHLLDLLAGAMRTVRVAPDGACPLCGNAPRIREINAENYVFGGCAVPIGADGEPLEISPEEVRQRLSGGGAPLVLDVREPFERLGGFIPGSLNIPLEQLGQRAAELPASAELFVVCQKGMRSLKAARLLREKGRAGVRSIRGGMDEFSKPTL
jgi:adenylyltransferase/sulfurtransferase